MCVRFKQNAPKLAKRLYSATLRAVFDGEGVGPRARVSMDFSSFREQFEPHLRRFLHKKEQDIARYSENVLLQRLSTEPRRLLDAGGKRVRPLLCYAGYRAGGGTDTEAILQAAVALELFHTFALIHDDIMDRGEDRHGVPTVHRSIEGVLRQDGRTGDVPHVAVSQAIILGDLLFSWSVEALACAPFSFACLQAAQQKLFTMSDEVMVGQMLDIDLTTRGTSSMQELREKMLLKTAGYTFVRPFEIGLALAGNTDPSKEAFAQAFGNALGLAFQIQDDLVDAFGTLEETGKTPLSDVRDHQHSYLTQQVLERGTSEQADTLRQVWGASCLTEQDIQHVRAVFVDSGAYASAKQACLQERQQAERLLAQADLPPDVRTLLESVLQKAVPLTAVSTA